MQIDYGIKRAAIPGMRGNVGGQHTHTFVNSALDVAQVGTLSGIVAAPGTFSLSIDGIPVSVTADASDTDATLQAALLEAISFAGSSLNAVAAGADITLTGEPGMAVTVTASAPLTYTQTTAAVASATIPFGVAVVRAATDADREARLPSAATGQKFLGVTLIADYQDFAYMDLPTAVVGYGKDTPMCVLYQGDAWVAIAADITLESGVYYLTSGADAGKFVGTAAAGAVQLPNAKWLDGGKAGSAAHVLLT